MGIKDIYISRFQINPLQERLQWANYKPCSLRSWANQPNPKALESSKNISLNKWELSTGSDYSKSP